MPIVKFLIRPLQCQTGPPTPYSHSAVILQLLPKVLETGSRMVAFLWKCWQKAQHNHNLLIDPKGLSTIFTLEKWPLDLFLPPVHQMVWMIRERRFKATCFCRQQVSLLKWGGFGGLSMCVVVDEVGGWGWWCYDYRLEFLGLQRFATTAWGPSCYRA